MEILDLMIATMNNQSSAWHDHGVVDVLDNRYSTKHERHPTDFQRPTCASDYGCSSSHIF